MTRWLTVIGIGEDGLNGLTPASRALVEGAEIIVGSARVLDAMEKGSAEYHAWASNLNDTLDQVTAWRGQRVVVFATGDPSNYGIARKVLQRVPLEEVTIVPAPSAFSLAAARLGWSVPDVETITLHGRNSSLIEPYIEPGSRVLALTWDAQTVGEAVRRLRARGFEESEVTVLEHMGGPRERVLRFCAKDDVPKDIADFNTMAIVCVAGRDARILPQTPGLPDEAYEHDGQLTKRDVRAVTVGVLGPYPHALLWDVGAGCGSVAIEWMRARRGVRAIAFERDRERVAMAARNAGALGVPGLELVEGQVPGALAECATPDAAFIGGAVADNEVFAAVWSALRAGGRLVSNAVTLEGEAALVQRHKEHGGELVRLDISNVAQVGRLRAMKPRMSVLQWRVTKPSDAVT